MVTINIKDLIRKDLQNLEPYSSARNEFSGAASVFLDANENPFETNVNRYPDPNQFDLKTKLSVIKGVRIEQLLLGNGSDEVIDLIFRGFCNPQVDFAVSIAPSYGMYDVSAKINGVELRKVLLNNDFTLDVNTLIKTAREAKLVFICSPNNPTGNSFSRSTIQRVLHECKGLVIVDEAYIDFSEKKSIVDLITENPRLIVLQTLSKAWGMAGLRLGFCIANEEICNFLHKIKPPYNINCLTQDFALNRLEQSKTIKNEIASIISERKRIMLFFEELEIIETVFPTDANFILIRMSNATKMYSELVNNGIIVRNRSNQVLCDNTLRISIGTHEENEKLIHVFKQLNKLKK
jgi:histidinol-phosphate aminotransferase